MINAPAKFEVAAYNRLRGDAFTRNVTDVHGQWTDFGTKLIYPFFFLRKKEGIINDLVL